MCSNEPGAKSNTHTVISATLEFQSSSVRLQPPSTTQSTSQQSSTSVTSTLSATSTGSSTSTSTSSSSLVTSTGVAPVTAPVKTQPPAESQTTAPVAPPTESPKLTKPQIVGITVAALGGTAVMLGIIAILACAKRRRRRDYRDSSDELPLSMDPSYYPPSMESRKSSRYPMQFGPGGTFSGVAQKVPPPVPRRVDVVSPNMFSRRSMQGDEIIGLAISPEINQSPVMQRPRGESKLLPPKPNLRLQMPPKAAAKFSKSAPKPMTFNRESTMTTFDEDFERPGWAPQIPPTPKYIPEGVGLSFPPRVADRPTLRRESTATLFEDVEENGVRKSQVGNARGVSYVQPATIQPMPVPRESTGSPMELDSAPVYPAYKPRESSATQFEEEGADNMGDGAIRGNTDRRSRMEQDLDNTIDEWERYTPINTTGPPAFYFTASDVQGSEVSTASSVPMPVTQASSQAKPVIVGRKVGSFSKPRNPTEYPPRKDSMEPGLDAFPKPPKQMPLQIKIPVNESRPITTSSSVYTTQSTSIPGNSPTPSLPPTGSLPQIPAAYRQNGPYDGGLKTGNSLASFRSNDSLSPGGPRTGELQLSPVFESPASGRSRVSYPKIPKPGRLEQSTLKTVPPPAQPNFTPTKPSETKKPWELAEAAARERERVRQLRRQSSLTGPPQGIMIHLPPTSATTRTPNPRLSTYANYSPQSPNWDVYTPTPISPSGPSFSSSNLPFALSFPAPPPQTQERELREPTLPTLSSPFTSPRVKQQSTKSAKFQDPTPNTPGIRLSRASSGLSHISETSQDSPATPGLSPSSKTTYNNSPASSHLALRAKKSKPRALQLSHQPLPSHSSNQNQKQTQNGNAMWRPLIHTGDRNLLSPDSRRVVENGGVAFEKLDAVELPGTPGWVPKLTPTRKGEDLYLRVA
jgi:hypothetical protein